MILTQRSLLRFFFGVEVVVFILMYLFSPHGIKKLFIVKKETAQLNLELNRLKNQVDDLQHKVTEWKEDPFYKEKVAREKLYMSREHEEVYFIE
ncbi:septum formation initiator family protein [Candidatus Babeliales bacterium]|nr:septum formation initiator family protein [Candidatus Babeliales bacterium]